jgi:hypothetical protein
MVPFYGMLFHAAEVAAHYIAGVRLTGLTQRCGMTSGFPVSRN